MKCYELSGVAWLVLGWPVAAFGFDVEIVAADECEGLTYSAIKQSPYLTSTGTQYAEFDLQCNVTNLPPGVTVTYQWSPVQADPPKQTRPLGQSGPANARRLGAGALPAPDAAKELQNQLGADVVADREGG